MASTDAVLSSTRPTICILLGMGMDILSLSRDRGPDVAPTRSLSFNLFMRWKHYRNRCYVAALHTIPSDSRLNESHREECLIFMITTELHVTRKAHPEFWTCKRLDKEFGATSVSTPLALPIHAYHPRQFRHRVVMGRRWLRRLQKFTFGSGHHLKAKQTSALQISV